MESKVEFPRFIPLHVTTPADRIGRDWQHWVEYALTLGYDEWTARKEVNRLFNIITKEMS